MKALNKIYFYLRAIPKTLLFNFYYLPFKQAIKLPLIISHRVKVSRLSGRIHLIGKIKTGKIRIGFGNVQVADPSKSSSIWSLSSTGIITFSPNIKLGTGTRLDIRGQLKIGEGSNFTGETTIICNKQITFGKNNLISWQTLFMDTDLHNIVDLSNSQINPDLPISIGDNVWVCAKSTVLKGGNIGNNTVVSANSNVVKPFSDSDIIIGGNPAKTISTMKDKKFIH